MKFSRAITAVTAVTMAVAPVAIPVSVATANALSLAPSAAGNLAPDGVGACDTPIPPIARTGSTGSAPGKASTSPATTPGWLARVNAYRRLAGVPAITENATSSHADALHARYEVKNNTLGHTEDPGCPFYTAAGATAASKSNVMASYDTATTNTQAVDMWMQGPFHAVGIIDPKLHRTGYGAYRQNFSTFREEMAAALDVFSDWGSVPASVHFPVKYPSGTTALPIRSAPTGEYPDPLSGCSGYAAPTGPPIILQLGAGYAVVPHVTAHALKVNGVVVPSCEFDETNYRNTTQAGAQALVRSILDGRDAVVLMPKKPLNAGKTYAVSITANGHTYSWSFKVAANAQ